MRRTWTNPAHHQVPIWKLFGMGSVMGVSAVGFAELLLRLAS